MSSCLLLQQPITAETALGAANRPLEAVRAPLTVADQEITMTASIGIALSSAVEDPDDEAPSQQDFGPESPGLRRGPCRQLASANPLRESVSPRRLRRAVVAERVNAGNFFGRRPGAWCRRRMSWPPRCSRRSAANPTRAREDRSADR
jgi:hypothetical protein